MRNKNPMKLVVPPEVKREMKAKKRKITAATPKNDGGPDWEAGRSTSGGKAHEIERPWVLRFPNTAGCRQDVSCAVSSWRGIAFGASHYYARVEAEANAIWDPKELTWYRDDHEAVCKQTFFRAHVFTRKEAVDFVELVVKAFFSDKTRYRLTNLYAETEEWEDIKQELLKDAGDI